MSAKPCSSVYPRDPQADDMELSHDIPEGETRCRRCGWEPEEEG